jgi:ribosomal protein S27AE
MSNLEPLNDECNHCGDGILVDNFYDGAEYPCGECGGMNYWCVFDDDEAYLASGDTPLDRIQTLTASRDQWKSDCVELQKRVKFLEEQLATERAHAECRESEAEEMIDEINRLKGEDEVKGDEK